LLILEVLSLDLQLLGIGNKTNFNVGISVAFL
jgi:hypothetical protein